MTKVMEKVSIKNLKMGDLVLKNVVLELETRGKPKGMTLWRIIIFRKNRIVPKNYKGTF